MAKISTYPILSTPTINDLLIGTDVDNLNITKNFSIGDIANFIVGGSYVPYTGATANVNLGTFNITSGGFIVNAGTAAQFLKANGTLDSTVYQPAGNYITQLSGEATASGPGNATVTLSNAAVIGKVLTGLTITGNAIVSTDSILTAFGKVQNQINTLVGGVQYKGTWNAATNTPALVSSVGVAGNYYVVSVAGNTNLNGITDWNLGDWAIFNGSVWEKVDNTDAVISVNGQIGAVVLTTTNIAEGTNLYYTDSRARLAINLTTVGNSGAATYNNTNGFFNIPEYTLAGLGGVPSTRQITINGVTQDLSANRTYNVGTVTSVATTAPLTGGTITGTGTLGITQAGAASDGYLSSADWTTFNNKQNTITNPVTGTGTVFFLPMWGSASSLINSPLSYLSDTFTFQYNSATGGTVSFTNSNGTAYTYSIQMNNFGSPRSTVHSYTDGIVIQSIAGVQVSRVFANGNTIFGTGVADNGHKLELSGSLFVNTIANATTDTDKFLVSDAGVIKYRTGTELLSDIGAGVGSVTSVGLSMPNAFNVANSPITSSGTIAVTGAGTASQYVRGDGTLADFPTSTGGGSSVSYYLNGSVNQGTFVGNTYYEMSKTPIFGAGTNFNIAADGYIAQFITDAGDPALLNIPAGNWNFETYFSASSAGGTPSFYVELYRYDGTTFTLIASSVGVPELISFGTATQPYFSTLAVPQTALAATDRLAVRYFVNVSGRTITLHTENGHLCQIVTTFSSGLTALNGLTAQVQYFQVGTSGTDFNIASASATHTFNLPDASASARGVVTTGTQTIAGEKTFSNTITVNTPINGLSTIYNGRSSDSVNSIRFNSNNASTIQNFIQSTPNDLIIGTEGNTPIYFFTNNQGVGGGLKLTISGSGSILAQGSFEANSIRKTGGTSSQFLKADGSVDSSTYLTTGSAASTYLPLAGGTLTGALNGVNAHFTNLLTSQLDIRTETTFSVKHNSTVFTLNGYNSIQGNINSFVVTNESKNLRLNFPSVGGLTHTLPDSSGTLALTSDLNGYVTLATTQTITGAKTFDTTTSTFALMNSTNANGGVLTFRRNGTNVGHIGNSAQLGGGVLDAIEVRSGIGSSVILKTDGGQVTLATGGGVTLTGALIGTTSTFTNSGAGIGVGVTNSGASGDGIKITHSAGRAFNIQSSGAGYGIIINNDTASTSAPFTIQKNGASVITMTDAGAVTLTGALNGTSASFSGTITGGKYIANAQATYSSLTYEETLKYSSSPAGIWFGNSFNSNNNVALQLRTSNDGTSVQALTLASTGAATFSSTIGSAGDITITKSSDASLIVNNTSASGKSYRLVSKDDGKFYIQNTGVADLFNIASTGTATFSSSVTANLLSSINQVIANNSITTPINDNTLTNGTVYALNGISTTNNYGIGVSGIRNGNYDIWFQTGSTNGGGYRFYKGTSELMTIATSGNVGIGTASPSTYSIAPNLVVDSGANGGGITIKTGTTASTSNYGFIGFADGTSGNEQYRGYIQYSHNFSSEVDALQFGTSGERRMTITSGGAVGMGKTSSITGLDVFMVTSDTINARSSAGANSSNSLFTGWHSASATTSGTLSFNVTTNGNVTNTNGSYGAISDVKLKENIKDATPKLEDLMKVKIRNYNLIGDDKKQIGVIAQELEEVFPAMIDESEDFDEVEVPKVDEEGNEILNEEGEVVTTKERVSKGTTTKSVKYSVFVPMLIKAMQEQQEQIKELKTEIDSLKNQMQ